jgi:hypothetical protein
MTDEPALIERELVGGESTDWACQYAPPGRWFTS